MILLIPTGLILAAAIAIIIQNRFFPKFGTSWIIASASSIIAWVVIFILRLRLPSTLELLSWQGAEVNLLGHFSLLLDYNSWPYVLALTTVTLAVILTDAARTRYDSTPASWSASLFIAALGLLALQAGTSLTLMVAWVVVDLFELFYLLRLKDSSRFLIRIIISYAVRTVSILVLVLATTQAWQFNQSFDLTQIPQRVGFLFLLAAGLRLGVFPLNLPFLQEPNLRRGAGNIIRLAPVASSLSLLACLPAGLVPENLVGWMPLFEAMLSFAALYAAIRWLTAGDEIEGRPFWIIAWAAFATASVLNGAPDASLAWGIALILPGSLLFLYFPRIQRMNFLLWLGLVGLVGLPYTPLASGWAGLMAEGLPVWTFLFILAHALIILGYLDRVMQPGGEVGTLESWARLVYPLGLILIIQALIALGLIGWPGSFIPGMWWLPLASNLLVITAVLLIRRYDISPPYIQLPASSGIAKVLNWILPRLEPIFRLEWIYRTVWYVNNFIGKILRGISVILEGDGGILWTILLLVLLVAFLAGGGMNYMLNLPTLAFILIVVTAMIILIFRDWRINAGSLAAQYLAVFVLVTLSWPIGLSIVKLIVGWMATAALALTCLRQLDADDTPVEPASSLVFRGLAGLFVIMVTFVMAQNLQESMFPRVDLIIIQSGTMLLGMALMQLGTSADPYLNIISLLSILAGFELIHAALELSTLLTGLLVIVNLGLALIGVYFITKANEKEQQPEEGETQ